MRKQRWLAAVLSLGVLGGGVALSARAQEEGMEVKVKLVDCPEAVQKTLKEQAGGSKIESVDKETSKDGKTVIYEADVKIGGKTYEIQVAADGKLIHNKIDTEEDEKKPEKK